MSDPVLGTLERLINAQLAQSSPARRKLDSLAGQRLGIVLAGLGLELVLSAERERLRLGRAAAAAADVSISGTPIALLEALRAGRSTLVGRREIAVTGDAHVLESFAELLAFLQPDIEEVLAGMMGDVVAHESVRVAAAVRDWGRRAIGALAMNSGEYLQDERHALPARHEIDAFFGDVETLRDDVARAAARLDRLLASRSSRGRPAGSATGGD